MLKLVHNINRFYKTFGAELDMPNCRVRLRDLKNRDCLLETQFHITEILESNATYFCEEAYELDAWLNGIITDINNIIEGKNKQSHKHTKTCIGLILCICVTLALGYIIGRQHTIRQAELLDSTDLEYHISFGDEVHTYTFEGGEQ